MARGTLEQAQSDGGIMFKSLISWFDRKPPVPIYKNVDPNGPGFYKYTGGRWRHCEVQGNDKHLRWLSSNRLLELALDAAVALRQAQDATLRKSREM